MYKQKYYDELTNQLFYNGFDRALENMKKIEFQMYRDCIKQSKNIESVKQVDSEYETLKGYSINQWENISKTLLSKRVPNQKNRQNHRPKVKLYS